MLDYLRRLNEKRVLFIEIGLIFSLGVMLLLFNWGTVQEAWQAPVTYNPEWDRVQTIDDVTPQTRQRTFAPPPPDVQLSQAPLSGNIETVLNNIMETELATTELNADRDIALPASAFTGESPSIAVPEEQAGNEAEIFAVVEEMPAFPGGDAKLLEFLYSEIKYPSMALENRIQGLVVVQFVIDEQGKITNPTITRGIGGGCDEEALRVVQSMPKWKPGKQRGRPVKVRYNLPVRFQLKTD